MSKVVARGADGGVVNGVVNQDHLRLDRVYLQAKRWKSSVGEPIIQGFVSTSKDVIMTTSSFAQPAVEFANKLTDRRILLLDAPVSRPCSAVAREASTPYGRSEMGHVGVVHSV